MKNLYSIFHIPYQASVLDICKSYQKLCVNHPKFIFYYTKVFKILALPTYKALYDAIYFNIDLRFTIHLNNEYLNEEEEYELASIISWIEDFREYVYDTKYFCDDLRYLEILENWYDEVETILFQLKNRIETFYLN